MYFIFLNKFLGAFLHSRYKKDQMNGGIIV